MSPQCHSVPIKCICEKGKKKSDLSHNNLLDEAKSRSQGNQMNGNAMQNIDIECRTKQEVKAKAIVWMEIPILKTQGKEVGLKRGRRSSHFHQQSPSGKSPIR